MPVHQGASSDRPACIVRRVDLLRGTLRYPPDGRPAFDYARATHEAVRRSEGILFPTPALSLWLQGTVPLHVEHGRAATAEFELRAGERAVFVLEAAVDAEALGAKVAAPEIEEWLQWTIAYWRRWLAHSRYVGRWREMVHRSALVLKLLTFEPTGALVAAPTTSLPEEIGGIRNWDYRYTWLRDSSLILHTLEMIGYLHEASDFFDWLDALPIAKSKVQPMYTIKGYTDITEIELPDLDGYRRSKPVRIGNDAYKQRQLDIFGEVLD